jgi:hypothetical protein
LTFSSGLKFSEAELPLQIKNKGAKEKNERNIGIIIITFFGIFVNPS